MSDFFNMPVGKCVSEKEKLQSRDYSFDNMRGFLIFTVVLAHILEISPSVRGNGFLYNVIYSFHMPAFLFLFGYFVKYNPKKILFHWVIPYVVFQTIYVLGAGKPLQYTTPYWLLWYLLACIVYQLLIPIYQAERKYYQILILLSAILLALLAGFENRIGYYLSLSRILVFQPWFLLGLFCRKNEDMKHSDVFHRFKYLIYGISIVLIILSAGYIQKFVVDYKILYASVSYQGNHQLVWIRASLYIIGLSWIVFLSLTSKFFLNKKIYGITGIGQNTFPIFLIHGFLVRGISVYCPQLVDSPWKVVGVTCLLVFLFGNSFFKKLIYYISLSCLEKTGVKKK